MTRVAKVLQNLALSADDIAARAKLPRERVSKILGGEAATLADLQALAKGLRLPLRAFAHADSEPSDLALLFRTTAASRTDHGVESAADFVSAALSILPKRTSPPDWIGKLQPRTENYDEAVRLAEEFRSLFVPDRLDDALADLPDILVNLGGVVIGRLATSRFEGASVVADGYAFIFVSPRFAGRMLFTVAHELGHLLAHHGHQRAAVFDRATQIGGRRIASRSEAFVNAFASALLVPTRGLGIALQQIRSLLKVKSDEVGDVELLYLARFYGVSFDVAARRCEDLNLLPQGGAISLVEHLRRHHGGAEKRAETLGIPARPPVTIPAASQNLLMAAATKIEAGDVSAGWVADRFGCSISDIYATRSGSGASSGPHH